MTLKDHIEYMNEFNKINLTTPENWMNNNKAGFPKWLTNTFIKYAEKDKLLQNNELFPHQKLIRDYLQFGSPYRGLLLYHGLGVGKTRTSIGVCEMLLKSKNKDKALILLPASLHQNYVTELKLHGNIMYNVGLNSIVKIFWKYFNIDKTNPDKLLIDNFGAKFIKKLDGIWIPYFEQSKNSKTYIDMSEQEQNQLKSQIDDLIDFRYQFIHYNGLTGKYINDVINSKVKDKDNLFDNKIIIIDEVHHMTMGLYDEKNTTNQKTLMFKLYDKLCNAKNSNFILLSGTPIINEPIEIAYTINLLRGKQLSYRIELNGIPQSKNIRKQLKYVDMYSTKQINKNKVLFTFNLIPDNYVVVEGKLKMSIKLLDEETKLKNNEKYLKHIEETLTEFTDIKGNKIEILRVLQTPQTIMSLPLDQKEFDETFIDKKTLQSKANNLFMKRIIGTVSYYENYDKKLYPSQLDSIYVNLSMSENQFKQYIIKREEDIKSEKKLKASQNSKQQATSGTYRVFTRALCNFAFPEKIKRPFPKSIKAFMNELDLSSGENIQISNMSTMKEKTAAKTTDYNNRIQKALHNLNENKSKYLKIDEGLEIHSPKFNALIKNCNNEKGTSLVYSDFRTVEGLNILGFAFEANHWTELKVVRDEKSKTLNISFDIKAKNDKSKYQLFAKYSNPDNSSFMKEANEIIMNIFNNNFALLSKDIIQKLKEIKKTDNLSGDFLKTLMITQSGSEGISLKNVRSVHLLEPYWNNIRLDQVIGRANRTNSHIELPVNNRNFRAYYYVSVFSEKQKRNLSQIIKINDKSMTTDQDIKTIADRKSKKIQGFLNNMKNASIDCAIHKQSHKNMKCLKFTNVDDLENAYTFNIEDEYIEREISMNMVANLKTQIVTFKTIKGIEDKKLLYVPNQEMLYDHNVYQLTGQLIAVGTMQKLDDGEKYNISIFSNLKK
jgi:hypothetical protein